MINLHDNKRATDTDGSYYFELRTAVGLTEVYCIVAPSESTFNNFSMRFSIIRPKQVINQTFMLLKKLNDEHPIKIFDTEIHNHFYRKQNKGGKIVGWFKRLVGPNEQTEIERLCFIPINYKEFILNQYGITNRKLIINNDKGEVIESGMPTLDFINKNHLYDKYIGWFKEEL